MAPWRVGGCLDNVLQAVNLPFESALIFFLSKTNMYFEHRKCKDGQEHSLLRVPLSKPWTHIETGQGF